MSEPTTSSNPATTKEEEVTAPPVKLTKAQKKELYYVVTYPEPLDTRRKILRDVFAAEVEEDLKTELLTTIVYQILEESDNPFTALIDLYNVTKDRVKEKNSLADAILKTALSWMKKRDETIDELRTKFVSEIDKKEAFKSIVKVHTLHLACGNELFDFNSQDFLPFIIQHIEAIVQNSDFKLAMSIAAAFSLHNYFPYDVFVLPCYLQEHHDVAKEYLKEGGCIEQQKQLIQFFDNFIDQGELFVHDGLRPYAERGILKMKREIFLSKALLKRVKELVKYFELEREETVLAPRMLFHYSLHSMLYDARRRFTDRIINDACYFQLLRDEIRNAGEQLKKAFIGRLYRLGLSERNSEYFDDAVRWIVYLKLSDAQLFQDVVEYMNNNPSAIPRAEQSIAECEQTEDLNDLKLLDKYAIVWVKDSEGVRMLVEKFSNAQIIALDSEWKQKSGSMNADQIALLQLYLSEKVYLVDFIALEESLSAEEWKTFLTELLTGSAMKLGFDLLNDVRAMFAGERTSPLRYLEEQTNNVICLKNLVHNVLAVDSELIQFDKKPVREDSDINLLEGDSAVLHFKLSDLSEKVANRKLDKSEQCSNWAARPLREAQMIYAALDAYIVYELYDIIYQRAIDSPVEMNWEEIVKQSIWNASRKDRAKKKTDQKIDNMAWSEIVEMCSKPALDKYDEPKKPGDIQLLIDSHLKGLGKNLRRLGVDVLWPQIDGESVIRLANKLPHRLIITTSSQKKVHELRSRFAGRVYYLEGANEVGPLESAKSIINRLNIQLSPEDVFSRCMDCNAAKFIRVPRPVMQALYEATVIISIDDNDDPFDLHGWLEVLRKVDERDYDGIGCEVEVHPEYPDLVNILCHGGSIDIVRNLAMHHTDMCPIDTLIHKVSVEVIKKDSIPFYYVCGGCGKVYWDGSHAVSYGKHIESLMSECATQQEPVKT